MGTENVKLGVCHVIFDGVNLGVTKGGVEVEVTTETHEVQVDQFGNAPINEYITGRAISVRVPMAETTVENLTRIMPGTSLVSNGGTKSTGTVTIATVPVATDTVRINGEIFTFRTGAAPLSNDVLIGGSAAATAANLLAKLVASISPTVCLAQYSIAGAIITVTYNDATPAGNAFTLVSGQASVTLSGAVLTGGVLPTKKKGVVLDGTGLNLLTFAKKLVLHPKGLDANDRSEDFTIPKAMTPGALNFAYKLDDERVFNVEFKGYPDSVTGILFVIGDETAV